MSLAPVVQDWLRTLQGLADRWNIQKEKEKYLTDSDHGVPHKYPGPQKCSREEWDALLAEADRLLEVIREGVRKRGDVLANQWPVIPFLKQARLFDLSPDIQLACVRRSMEMVGSPDLSALPFPICWFNIRAWDWELCKTAKEPRKGCVVALVASREGKLWWVVEGVGDKDLIYVDTEDAVTAEGWNPESLENAWIVYLLAAVVNSQPIQRPATQSFSLRRELGKLRAKGITVPPPDLYTLVLNKQQASRAVSLAIAAHSGPSYRYEVRKHERMLVHRGHWPLKNPEDLKERGYVVERGDQLSERAILGLELRGIPAGERDEWVAWKFVPVREHEAGLKGGELRRAVRTTE